MKSFKKKLNSYILRTLHSIGRGRQAVYLIFLAIGVALVLIGAIIMEGIIKDIFIGLGCGFMPSALTGFLTDFANTSSDLKRNDDLNKSFLFRLPHGILFAVKTVTEEFSPCEGEEGVALIDVFRKAIGNMQSSNKNDSDFLFETDNVAKLLNKLSYGLSLCTRDAIPLLENRTQLILNGVFTETEISAIGNVLDECGAIEGSATLDVMGGYLENLVSAVYEGLPSVKKLLDSKVTLENGRIKNWQEICKREAAF